MRKNCSYSLKKERLTLIGSIVYWHTCMFVYERVYVRERERERERGESMSHWYGNSCIRERERERERERDVNNMDICEKKGEDRDIIGGIMDIYFV